MEYTTLATLKQYLGISNNTYDVILADLIKRGSDMLSTELWDDIGKKTVTRRHDSYGSNRVILEYAPNEVINVEHTNNNWYNRTPVEIDYVDWYTIYLKKSYCKGSKVFKVTYTKWYDTVPQDIETFFLKYVSILWSSYNLNKKQAKEVKSKKIDILTVTYFWPNELASRDGNAYADYELIKNKYRVFSFHRG